MGFAFVRRDAKPKGEVLMQSNSGRFGWVSWSKKEGLGKAGMGGRGERREGMQGDIPEEGEQRKA